MRFSVKIYKNIFNFIMIFQNIFVAIILKLCIFSISIDDFHPSTLLSSSKRIYPRGIINPNYPGFQRFAHTLSEHFIEHQNSNVQSGNMSDSDLSEVESDTQNDSLKMNANILDFENVRIDCDPNGNSIVETESVDIEREDNLNKVAEILRTVFESNSSHLSNAIETLSVKETTPEKETNIYNEFDEYFKMTDCMIECDEFNGMIGSQPPDILQKSSSSESGFESNAEKPDILLDVSDQNDCDGTLLMAEKDESNSITPVDIVGNFEQEVQREIGLLVTRYKKKNDIHVKDSPYSNEKMFNKVNYST